MSTKVKLTKFTDFDRMLEKDNFIVTLFGALAAFVLSFISETILPIPFSPFRLSFSLAILFFAVVYTKNIASSLILGIITGISIVSPFNYFDSVDFINGYVIIVVLVSVILGFYANRLMLVMKWNRQFMGFGFISSSIVLLFGYLSNSEAHKYWENGIPIGVGGDPYLDTGLPLIEIAAFLILFILFIIPTIMLRQTLSLSRSSAKKYKLWGSILVSIGFILSLAGMILFNYVLSHEQMIDITSKVGNLDTINELINHQASDQQYSVFISPINGFVLIAVSNLLFMMGISFHSVGVNRGNIDGIRARGYMLFFAPILTLLTYIVIGSYQLQRAIIPNGYYVGLELLPVYMSMLWSLYIWNTLLALILYALFTKILKQK
ncbi:MAG: hypothetical protein INQ03_01645 [Candidatus Heimdallarchaeota archaeon]|nr:hypothetical protein [Candidatus Heimdallarchaeota archaeon]